MVETHFDPTKPSVEKLQVAAPEPAEPEADALKARIATQVRDDSRRGAPTSEHAIAALVPELAKERIGALLAEMAEQAGLYADIKAIVAASGRIYLYSELHLSWLEASDACRLEEARIAMAQKIRADSAKIVLTTLADLEPFFPMPEPEKRTAFVAALLADERFKDIHQISGPNGEAYFHSDAFVSGNYSTIMMRAKAKDPCWSMAELVRDRSRIQPAPTHITLFREEVFELDPAKLDAHVEEMLAQPKYADIKRLVHRKTGAVYFYSDRYLDERRAYFIMDWEEVGQRENP